MATPHTHSWHTFPKGTRVLDTQTGMDGVVLHTKLVHAVEAASTAGGNGAAGGLNSLPNPVVHETVVVQLEDGTIQQRSPRTLVAL